MARASAVGCRLSGRGCSAGWVAAPKRMLRGSRSQCVAVQAPRSPGSTLRDIASIGSATWRVRSLRVRRPPRWLSARGSGTGPCSRSRRISCGGWLVCGASPLRAAPLAARLEHASLHILGVMYFYELHESDDELFASIFLAHDSEYDEQEFLELVLESQRDIGKTFEEESLIEGIAAELERKHGFVQVEANLRASVRVSAEEGETVITAVDERQAATPTEEDDF